MTDAKAWLIGCQEAILQPRIKVVLFSSVTASAISAPAVQGNWMSSRILTRIKAEKHDTMNLQRSTQIQTLDYQGTQFRSTGQFIDLACDAAQERLSCRHRFHIVRDEREDFDILLGSDLPHSGTGAIHAEFER